MAVLKYSFFAIMYVCAVMALAAWALGMALGVPIAANPVMMVPIGIALAMAGFGLWGMSDESDEPGDLTRTWFKATLIAAALLTGVGLLQMFVLNPSG